MLARRTISTSVRMGRSEIAFGSFSIGFRHVSRTALGIMAPHVLFICFSSVDRQYAEEFEKHVSAEIKGDKEFSVFLDSTTLKPGDDWPQKISEALGNTIAACFIASVDLLNSQGVLDELPTLVSRERAGKTLLTTLYARPVGSLTHTISIDNGVPEEISLSDRQGLNQPKPALSETEDVVRERLVQKAAADFVVAARQRLEFQVGSSAITHSDSIVGSKCESSQSSHRFGKVVSLGVVICIFSALALFFIVPYLYLFFRDEEQVAPTDLRRTTLPGLGMVTIAPMPFRLGSPLTEQWRDRDEGPVENVSLATFRIATHEMTRGLWKLVLPDRVPSEWKDKPDDLPVTDVSWFDVIEFCNSVSKIEQRKPCYIITKIDDVITGVKWDRRADGYRLPTEAEWEYAARAGSASTYPWIIGENSDGKSELSENAWWSGNTNKEPKAVGAKRSNQFGLYDTIGNVVELTWDACLYKDSNRGPPNPVGADGDFERDSKRDYIFARVGRGSSVEDDFGNQYFRVAFRLLIRPDAKYHDVGFRIACSASR